mmetsp:Transcript_117186/g.304103  ORF Transcript_117186/g.304103 Transcript_117186/m.304103 type:complete len:87 (-) Transcript_117186:3682-3942(-)
MVSSTSSYRAQMCSTPCSSLGGMVPPSCKGRGGSRTVLCVLLSNNVTLKCVKALTPGSLTEPRVRQESVPAALYQRIDVVRTRPTS